MKTKLLSFLTLLILTSGISFGQIQGYMERSGLNPELEPFYHGVASGDPTTDGVIIWSRVTPRVAEPVEVLWRVALDTAFTNTVKSGVITTDESKDWTIKVNVTGLQPNTWYYYEFNAYGKNSLIGRTRTAPDGTVGQLRFATVSCSNYNAGYFNVYDMIAKRNDVDAVLHLGDYIYEYGFGGGFRNAEPDKEIVELSDYRIRHSVHKLDPQSIKMHQQYPLIATWDDHEVTNNSWRDGADNHQPNEGPYPVRKSVASQAYDEWMPTRLPEPDKPTKLWRKISYGGLADIFVLDTRHYDRDEQDAARINDPERVLLGKEQLDWLEAELKASTAQWKILAQQVMMAPLTPFGLTLNPDQWDGYTAERKRLYDIILNNNIQNVVVLTGDIHTAWGQDLPYDVNGYGPNGRGSVGVEFVCTSVTSGSSPIAIPGWLYGIARTVLPHVKYVDLFRKGYSLLDLTAAKAANHFYIVKTIGNIDDWDRLEQVWFVRNGNRFLQRQPNPETLSTPPVIQAPPLPRTSTVTPVNNQQNAVIVASYPNPFVNSFLVQYNLFNRSKSTLTLYSMNGQIVWSKNLGTLDQGLHIEYIDASSFPVGTYRLVIEADGTIYEKPVVKM